MKKPYMQQEEPQMHAVKPEQEGVIEGQRDRGEVAVEARHHLRTVIGRRVVRPVLDHGDGMILGAGEVITHRAIERARRAGALERLLNAVSWEEAHIDDEESRSREPDEGTLTHRVERD